MFFFPYKINILSDIKNTWFLKLTIRNQGLLKIVDPCGFFDLPI